MPNPKNEPAVITSLLVAAIGDAATLGLIGTSTRDLLVAAITTAVPIIFGLVVRAMVTPNAKAKGASSGTVYVDVKPRIDKAAFKEALAPADPPADDTAPTPDATPAPEPAPVEPAPSAPVEDPVKAQLKAAIESVRANSNALNDARAQAAKAAVDASS